jgi:hypothetical protein
MDRLFSDRPCRVGVLLFYLKTGVVRPSKRRTTYLSTYTSFIFLTAQDSNPFLLSEGGDSRRPKRRYALFIQLVVKKFIWSAS